MTKVKAKAERKEERKVTRTVASMDPDNKVRKAKTIKEQEKTHKGQKHLSLEENAIGAGG